ncbi:MAG: hypothetical protein ACI8UP_004585 [Porticoccaceae bacterium]|jgi:hypothetical protein
MNPSEPKLSCTLRYSGANIDVPLYEAQARYTVRLSDPDGSFEQSVICVGIDSQIDLAQ